MANPYRDPLTGRYASSPATVRVKAILDDAEAKAQLADLETQSVKIGTQIEMNEVAQQRSFDEIMLSMRSGYMLMAGMARVMGTGMTEVFRTSYQMFVSAIGVYQAFIALETAKGPAGWVQAALMTISLATAGVRLYGLATGQADLSRQMRGVWMGLHGVSSLLGGFMRA